MHLSVLEGDPNLKTRYVVVWYAIVHHLWCLSCNVMFWKKTWLPKPSAWRVYLHGILSDSRDRNNINTGFNIMCPGPCRMLGRWMTTRDSLTRSALHGNKQMPLRSVSWKLCTETYGAKHLDGLIVQLTWSSFLPFLSDLWGLIEDSERGSYFQSTTGSPDAWILIVYDMSKYEQ